jgi:hypothetical protein
MREDQIDQAERQAVLENDRLVREQQKQREASTFFQHSQSLADETSGGRFRANGTPRLIGATPTPQYPQAGPPFHRDPVPDEPPLPAHDNPALDETSTASPCVEATDDPADAPLSGSGFSTPSGGSVCERAGSSPSSQKDEDNGA